MTTMYRPYSHEAYGAAERELRGAADRAARRREARDGNEGRRRDRASAALAAGLRGVADRLDARRDARRKPAAETASGPC